MRKEAQSLEVKHFESSVTNYYNKYEERLNTILIGSDISNHHTKHFWIKK